MSIEHAVKGDMIFAFNMTAGYEAAQALLYPGITVLSFTFAEMMIPPEFSVSRVLLEQGLATSRWETSLTMQKRLGIRLMLFLAVHVSVKTTDSQETVFHANVHWSKTACWLSMLCRERDVSGILIQPSHVEPERTNAIRVG